MSATVVGKLESVTYEVLESRIREGDLASLLGRWEFGRKLRDERGERERLPKGRLAHLANELAVSAAELKNRMQFAAEHATPEDVRAAYATHGSWSEICARGLGQRGAMRSMSATPIERIRPAELVAVADLKPHPRNYRRHSLEELAHIIRSIEEHGFYRNVVVARDGTILAGHGSVNAAEELGLREVPVTRLDYDPNEQRALKILTGDNEIANLADDDDRKLCDMLKEVREQTGELIGTGYNDGQLVNRVFTATSRAEIPNMDAARKWAVGGDLPEHDRQPEPIRLVLTFESEELRESWASVHRIAITKRESRTWSARFPEREAIRNKTFRFDEDCVQVCLEESDLNDAERDYLAALRQGGMKTEFVNDPDWREQPSVVLMSA